MKKEAITSELIKTTYEAVDPLNPLGKKKYESPELKELLVTAMSHC